jgi:hypothetical protein
MNIPTIPKFDKVLLIPIVISIAIGVFTVMIMQSYSGQTDNNINLLYGYLMQMNDTYTFVLSQGRNITTQYMLARQDFTVLSQLVNNTQKDNLQAINTIKESNKNLQTQLDALNSYVHNLNLTAPAQVNATPQVIYVNRTVTVQAPVDNRSCRKKIMDEHGLGDYFDVVACCYSTPPVGYWQECCGCFE